MDGSMSNFAMMTRRISAPSRRRSVERASEPQPSGSATVPHRLLMRAALFALTSFACCLLHAETVHWTLTNHAGDYSNELVRLKIALQTPFDATRLVVTENGQEIPAQVEVHQGRLNGVEAGDLWVCTTIASKASHGYTVTTGGTPRQFQPRVKVSRDGDSLVLDNGLVAVRLPDGSTVGNSGSVGPILAMRATGGPWLGASSWDTPLALTGLTTTVIGEGKLFGRVKLRFEFAAPATPFLPDDTARLARRLTLARHGASTGFTPATNYYAEFIITLAPDQPLVTLEENHSMVEGDSWRFDLAPGWQPRRAFSSRSRAVPTERELKPDAGLHDHATLMFLQPRWTQSTNCGWFFAAADNAAMLGAVAMRAGRWDWPYDNPIIVQASQDSDGATLVYPTWKGRRFSYLLAGPVGLIEKTPALIRQVAMQPLDKLVNEYTLDWPGLAPGGFQGLFWWDGNNINPSSMIRGLGRRLMKKYAPGSEQADRTLLGQFQVYLDPDCYGYYWNHFSPINPNFSTDLLKVPIAMCAGLKGHPDFPRFRQMAEDALRMDLDHAVTLPGGAGQECAGYLAHALGGWLDLAELCRTQLDFDPRQSPRLKAAASFLLHTSPPLNDGQRRILPTGDTHPPGPDVFALAERAGVREEVADFRTEELPGFGVVFRSHSGRPNENFLAFKAGPNRGHYHGDQLSFHYCGNGQRLAIDHMCSYSPRADQEHMHNRVAFYTDDWPFANMDGYERLIGFQTSADVDVAQGLVTSWRLRQQPRIPQEVTWNSRGPYQLLDQELQYQRTIVLVKHPHPSGQTPDLLDYFVIRDQATGPMLNAAYCLHVESNECRQDGPRFDFGTMTLFCAAPREFKVERFDWSFQKKGRGGDAGYGESTVGVRLLTTGAEHEFITVLYPASDAPDMESILGGVRVTLADGTSEEVAFRTPGSDEPADAAYVVLKRGGRELVALSARNLNSLRSQGDVGLCLPECGYDFGPVPDWLIRQRDHHPAPIHLQQLQPR